ncbi:Response regulator receiver domain-containing protein [Paracoccus aminovorans]|uniref:Response regulator receiver domain-containing protein n=1 Tax=Paracoccus aminovorans TaxID=34004 RepID=A0A1I2YJ65_9RHOB|nr:response regulator [Paracoccus aminovorans]CQR86719.1 chemotaxis protein CheY [Paracoccus aminovorans]SFH25610.1 Response regulator receiver domain-containing protein [Paracoccus aminovorans]
MTVDVLLIEDEPSIAEAVRFILAREGWHCEQWPEGGGALSRIRALAPRLVILDLMLPGRSGAEILAELRADPALAPLPVLLLSARGVANLPQGADRVLSKPFANADLRAVVRELLDGGA